MINPQVEQTEFCHDNPVFEAESGNETLIGSKTKIVITGIKKNSDRLNSSVVKSDCDLNEAKLNLSETISLTNEAVLVLKNSQQNSLSKKGNFDKFSVDFYL